MMLFMFAAIIFTMASTTVTAEQCASNQNVCKWAEQEGQNCDCIGTPCITDNAHKVSIADSAFYTCQLISAFRDCAESEVVADGEFSQLNCKCSSGTYVINNGAVVCG
nr:TPA_inf: conotoxin precursor Cerm08 [Conus judaeus]